MSFRNLFLPIVTGLVIGLVVAIASYFLITKPVDMAKRMDTLDSRLSILEGKTNRVDDVKKQTDGFDSRLRELEVQVGVITRLNKRVGDLSETMSHVQQELASIGPTEEREIVLTPAPNSWGRTISGSLGNVHYYDHSTGRFSGRITLRGLHPNEDYLLVLNGKPERSGNEMLLQRHGNEGFADIEKVRTDSQGNVSNRPFSVRLPPGDYDVKFFVKEATEEWKVVLYNDFVTFSVKPESKHP